MMKKLLFLLLLVISSGALAQNFTDNGINFTVTDPTNFKVAVASNSGFTGVANIPATVTYNSQSYDVTAIDDDAFASSNNLTSVIIPFSVTSIGVRAFVNCAGMTSITIGNAVTSIGASAFEFCTSLTTVIIPNSVTSIGSSAFLACYYLTSINLSNSLTSISDGTFSSCANLTSINIPNSVTSIGNEAFSNCNALSTIVIPNSVTSIDDGAFKSCNGLTSVIIPNLVTSIGSNTFKGCTSLTSIIIPDSVTSIGFRAFFECTSLTTITIPNSVSSIGNQVFALCSGLTSLTISNSLTLIGNSTFNFCTSLTNVTIPNSVTSIGNDAFSSCSNLTTLTIPNSVTSIGINAFFGCTALTTINCNIQNPINIDNYTFYSLNRPTCALNVPASSAAAYDAAPIWTDFNINQQTPATHLNFDGVDDYVAIPATAINNLTSGTIEAYVYANSLDGETICVKQSDFENTYARFSIGGPAPAGKVFFQPRNGISITSNATLVTGQWYHLAVTFNNTQAQLYINGVLDKTSSGDFSIPNDLTVTATSIGALKSNSIATDIDFYNGNIEEFRVWNVVKSAAQINCELQGTETGLVTYYKFNQGFDAGSNTAITSATATTGSNGTLTNFALTGATSNWLAGSPVTTGVLIPNAPTVSAQNFCVATTASSLVPAISTTIKWYASAATTTALVETDALTTGTYYVAAVNANGCESIRTESEVVTILNNATTQNLGTITATENTSGVTYQWYQCPNTLLSGATNRSYTPSVDGDYKVVVSKSSCTVTSDCQTVTFNPLNPITISNSCEDTNGTYQPDIIVNGKMRYKKGQFRSCSGVSLEYECDSSPYSFVHVIYWTGSAWNLSRISSFAINCVWFLGVCEQNGQSNTSTTTIIATNMQDTPTPSCTGWNFPSSPSCLPSFSNCTILGLNTIAFENSIKLFPNPSTGIFNISIQEDANVIVNDMLGKVIYTNKVKAGNNTIDISNYQSGIYLLNIANENGSVTKKIIKE